jgi:mycothiol synthase
MNLSRRGFSGAADLLAMIALTQALPPANGHVADWPYRLSSWALDDPRNVALWADGDGQLCAWAVLQAPFWTIDYVYHPQAGRDLHQEILAWAGQRARRALDTPSGRPCWFVMVLADQADRIGDLEAAGFVCQADVAHDPWARVLLHRPVHEAVADCALPAGFSIRPLAGEQEVEAYVGLHRTIFESKNMTVAWRRRAVRRPEYRPELDLVVEAPGGGLAAFCVGWVCLPGWLDRYPLDRLVGQIEPLGVHPDFRGLGLGRAILSEALRRLCVCGAEGIYVETDKDRNAALGLYEAVGFRPIQDILVYRRDY